MCGGKKLRKYVRACSPRTLEPPASSFFGAIVVRRGVTGLLVGREGPMGGCRHHPRPRLECWPSRRVQGALWGLGQSARQKKRPQETKKRGSRLCRLVATCGEPQGPPLPRRECSCGARELPERVVAGSQIQGAFTVPGLDCRVWWPSSSRGGLGRGARGADLLRRGQVAGGHKRRLVALWCALCG
jgi:hypothetical protein